MGESQEQIAQEKFVPWYIVYYAHPKNIKALHRTLSSSPKACKLWQPCITVECYTKGRIKEKPRPLFPGYVFVTFSHDPAENLKIIQEIGLRVLSVGGVPVMLTAEQASYYHLVEETVREKEDDSGLRVGDVIVIPTGAFSGLKGVVLDMHGDSLLIEIEFFKRRLPVTIQRRVLNHI